MQKFVLLADRRSGTTLVIDCLNNLAPVNCEKRAFGIHRKVENPTKDKHSDLLFHYRHAGWARKFQYYFDRGTLIRNFLSDEIYVDDPVETIRGFRLIYSKAEQYGEIIDILREWDVKVLHLVRSNVLKTYISAATAPIHKMRHPREGDTVRTVKVPVDTGGLLDELRFRNERIATKRRLIEGLPSLEVSYEDFVADRDTEAARIQPFLGLDHVEPFVTDLVKINPNSLADVVENYEEVCRVLRGTEFEKFLE